MPEQNNPFSDALKQLGHQMSKAWDDSWAAQKAIDAMLAGIYEDAGKPYGNVMIAQQRWFQEHGEEIRAWCKLRKEAYGEEKGTTL